MAKISCKDCKVAAQWVEVLTNLRVENLTRTACSLGFPRPAKPKENPMPLYQAFLIEHNVPAAEGPQDKLLAGPIHVFASAAAEAARAVVKQAAEPQRERMGGLYFTMSPALALKSIPRERLRVIVRTVRGQMFGPADLPLGEPMWP